VWLAVLPAAAPEARDTSIDIRQPPSWSAPGPRRDLGGRPGGSKAIILSHCSADGRALWRARRRCASEALFPHSAHLFCPVLATVVSVKAHRPGSKHGWLVLNFHVDAGRPSTSTDYATTSQVPGRCPEGTEPECVHTVQAHVVPTATISFEEVVK